MTALQLSSGKHFREKDIDYRTVPYGDAGLKPGLAHWLMHRHSPGAVCTQATDGPKSNSCGQLTAHQQTHQPLCKWLLGDRLDISPSETWRAGTKAGQRGLWRILYSQP